MLTEAVVIGRIIIAGLVSILLPGGKSPLTSALYHVSVYSARLKYISAKNHLQGQLSNLQAGVRVVALWRVIALFRGLVDSTLS